MAYFTPEQLSLLKQAGYTDDQICCLPLPGVTKAVAPKPVSQFAANPWTPETLAAKRKEQAAQLVAMKQAGWQPMTLAEIKEIQRLRKLATAISC